MSIYVFVCLHWFVAYRSVHVVVDVVVVVSLSRFPPQLSFLSTTTTTSHLNSIVPFYFISFFFIYLPLININRYCFFFLFLNLSLTLSIIPAFCSLFVVSTFLNSSFLSYRKCSSSSSFSFFVLFLFLISIPINIIISIFIVEKYKY